MIQRLYDLDNGVLELDRQRIGDLNVQRVAWLADKYDLPGMMELLLFRLKEGDVDPGKIADILIASGKTHQLFSYRYNSFIYSLQAHTTPMS